MVQLLSTVAAIIEDRLFQFDDGFSGAEMVVLIQGLLDTPQAQA